MQVEELHRKLQQSEAKRAKLVVELHQAQLAAEAAERTRDATMLEDFAPDALRTAYSAAPNNAEARIAALESRLAESEKVRAQLLRDAENRGFGPRPDAQEPTTTIYSMTESEADFGFDEEDDARERARQVMSELMRALHGAREAQSEAAKLRLQLSEETEKLRAAQVREANLLRMVDQYQRAFKAGRADGGGSGDGDASRTPSGAAGSLQAARVTLLEDRIKELTEENTHLRAARAFSASPMVAPSAASGGSRKMDDDAVALAKIFKLELANEELRRKTGQQAAQIERLTHALSTKR